jgi:hypothetical protein
MWLLRIFGLFNGAMNEVNKTLEKDGKPLYYLGRGKFNTDYKTDIRFVAAFPPQFLILVDYLPTGESYEVRIV